MGFIGEEEQIWNNYCHYLKSSHVRVNDDDDEIL
jgi:hypothetical protein